MKMNEYMERTEQVVLHTYNRFPVVFEKGEGVHLYDTEGKEYLDFGAGIAVFALGYHYADYDQALKDQIDKVIHTSNLFYNVPMMEAAEKLVKASGMSKVFFTNSGTEAIEGAIKAARKYAWNKDHATDHEIIAMNHSFHGRSVGALSVTGNPHYQEAFKPLMGGVKFADYNDLDSVKAQITDKTCAIIMETLQGEGGIYPMEERPYRKDVCMATVRRAAGYHVLGKGTGMRRAGRSVCLKRKDCKSLFSSGRSRYNLRRKSLRLCSGFQSV